MVFVALVSRVNGVGGVGVCLLCVEGLGVYNQGTLGVFCYDMGQVSLAC